MFTDSNERQVLKGIGLTVSFGHNIITHYRLTRNVLYAFYGRKAIHAWEEGSVFLLTFQDQRICEIM